MANFNLSNIVTDKFNAPNQRAYLEWLLSEMPNDPRLAEPGRIDRYLPWSSELPTGCRLGSDRVEEATEMPDEPIVNAAVLESALENS